VDFANVVIVRVVEFVRLQAKIYETSVEGSIFKDRMPKVKMPTITCSEKEIAEVQEWVDKVFPNTTSSTLPTPAPKRPRLASAVHGSVALELGLKP
jgi:hypothetical protein